MRQMDLFEDGLPRGPWQVTQREAGLFIAGFPCGDVGPLRSQRRAYETVRMLVAFYARHTARKKASC